MKMSKYLSTFVCIFLLLSCDARGTSCDGVSYIKRDLDAIKMSVLEKKPNDISEYIEYPIEIQIEGSMERYREEFVLDMDWEDIFTSKVVEKVKEANDCELVKYFSVRVKAGKSKIEKIAFNFDEKDMSFTSSGISSSKKLQKFITHINTLIQEQDYEALGRHFRYPYTVVISNKEVKILNEENFLANKNNIVNSKFKKLFDKAKDMDSLLTHPHGLMLNKRGDIWILEIDNELKVGVVGLNDE